MTHEEGQRAAIALDGIIARSIAAELRTLAAGICRWCERFGAPNKPSMLRQYWNHVEPNPPAEGPAMRWPCEASALHARAATLDAGAWR